MKRFVVLALLAGALVVVPAGVAPAASSGCATLNDSFWDGRLAGSMGWEGIMLSQGEVLTGTAGYPTQNGDPAEIELRVAGVGVASAGFPGTVTWTVPATGAYDIEWSVVQTTDPWRGVTWNLGCTPAGPPDADYDGVPDGDDVCPAGTTLGIGPPKLTANRYYAGSGGSFISGKGTDSGYTIADTSGCDEAQIVALEGLRAVYLRSGLTLKDLSAFVATH